MKTAMRLADSRQKRRKRPRLTPEGVRRVLVTAEDMERLRRLMREGKAERTEVDRHVERLIGDGFNAR